MSLASPSMGTPRQAWDTLWPLLLTALLTLTLTLWVQFYVIPRVETRKRRDDRWERDLLALGEMLTFEQPAAANALSSAFAWKAIILDPASGVDPERLPERLKDGDRDIRTAKAEYERIHSRVRWLCDLVAPVGDYSERLASFRDAYRRLRARHVGLSSIALLWTEQRSYSADEIDATARLEHEAVGDVVDCVKALVGHPPPTPKLRTRLRRRWARGDTQKL